jgi:putative heme-binding domain-containing protein
MKGFVNATFFTVAVLGIYIYIAAEITRISGGAKRGGDTIGRSPEVGETIFWGKGKCHTCHSLGDEGSAVRAPNLGAHGNEFPLPIATRAAERAKEISEKTGKPMTAADYIIDSHLNPSAYVVDGYKDEMPTVWKPPIALNLDEIFSVDLYLQSQGGEPNPEALTASPLYAELQKKTATAAEATTVAFRPYLEGDPEKGREMFFDLEGKAACAKCHAVGDQGGTVGPELTHVSGTRELPYIIESILEPSAIIVSGFEPYLVITIDQDYLTGIKKEETEESITLLTDEGELLEIFRDEIEEIVPQETSVMPANFSELLSVKELHNLIAFLQTLQ